MKLRELLQEENFCVYKITNLINGKIYIGKTFNINTRWEKHIKIAENKEEKAYQYLHKSINKYGVENFIIEELENNLTEQESFEKEKFWIKTLNSKNCDVGMNLTDGGEGASGLKWSEHSRDKIRGENNHNFGKELSLETKEKLSQALSGENNPFYNKKHSEETIIFLKNRPISEEQRKLSSEGTRGSNSPRAKLTEEKVLKIREMFSNGISQKNISELFGVKRHTINQIVNRVRWRHI